MARKGKKVPVTIKSSLLR